MPEYQLYCFAQSGNAYRAALMLNLIGADWAPVFVDFFGKGEQRTPEYRADVNEMGEVPVLVHGAKKLSQSGVILTYLAAYLYYPAQEFGFDIAAAHRNIAAWLGRMRALPGWAHPYDLMPGHPMPGA